MANTKAKKALGSELSSNRDSEERSSVPTTGRGQKRGRDNEIEKVCSLSLIRTPDGEPSLKRLRTRSMKGQAYDALVRVDTQKGTRVKAKEPKKSRKLQTVSQEPAKSAIHQRLAQYMRALHDSKMSNAKTTSSKLTNRPVKKQKAKKQVGVKKTAKKTRKQAPEESKRLPVFSLDWDIPEADRCDCYDCLEATPLDPCHVTA